MADLAVTVTRVEGLGETQEAAFAALRSGSTFAQAAQAAGVTRVTIYRWVANDPNFRAAYNAWQRELIESARARLLKLTEKAVDVVAKALSREDEKVAVAVLRHMGVMRGSRTGTTDPQLLSRKMDLQKRRREFRVDEDMVKHLLAKLGLSQAEREKYIREHGVGGTMIQMRARRRSASGAGEDAEGRRVAESDAPGEQQDQAKQRVAEIAERGADPAKERKNAPVGHDTNDDTTEGLYHDPPADADA